MIVKSDHILMFIDTFRGKEGMFQNSGQINFLQFHKFMMVSGASSHITESFRQDRKKLTGQRLLRSAQWVNARATAAL